MPIFSAIQLTVNVNIFNITDFLFKSQCIYCVVVLHGKINTQNQCRIPIYTATQIIHVHVGLVWTFIEMCILQII